jgi:methyltransferase OMS1
MLRCCCCCQGDVLEISAGTGRNLPHYNYSQLSSLTLTDVSQAMLQQVPAQILLLSLN